MAEMFSGDWTVQVIEMSGNSRLRFILQGSHASDGAYEVTAGMAPFSVSGPSWIISFEAFSPIPPKGWWPAQHVKRIGAAYTLQDGLDVSIRANSHFLYQGSSASGAKDFFSDCTLLCRNVEPQINPWRPFVNPYDFILPKRRRKPTPPTPPRPR